MDVTSQATASTGRHLTLGLKLKMSNWSPQPYSLTLKTFCFPKNSSRVKAREQNSSRNTKKIDDRKGTVIVTSLVLGAKNSRLRNDLEFDCTYRVSYGRSPQNESDWACTFRNDCVTLRDLDVPPTKVKPVLGDQRFKRPPAFSDHFLVYREESTIQNAPC